VKREVILERVYPYPPERLWRALTDPKALSDWLMPNDFEPTVGRKFQFNVGPQWGWRGYVDCVVLEVDAPRRLSYSWEGDPKHPPTVVTWILTPVKEGTLLRLEHTGFRGLRGLFLKFILGSGWKDMLRKSLPAVLARLTESQPSKSKNGA
jgi:uncharacterized protein YndB with AHSA1/START domain